MVFVAAPLTKSFLGASVKVQTKDQKAVCDFSVVAVTTPRVVAQPYVGKNSNWAGRVVRLNVVYPSLNSTTIPKKAFTSKLVPFSKFSEEYQRIHKAGGKIQSVQLANKEL
eukprot:CAMPEP_0196653686 /NCGR_PEP_ID=MMETSP1086-20130531/3330_1 /TAXON_ID=77921 /ORGANISM="Cyanoptyche  gloeocystis , Strain SAG4.97" /LENGTH=110 /DNA_ID=CAMNT_0041985007 /DNA_START=104 /DNA_END=436 /DNA_ORIENTATION=-